ncbi:MAG: CehA/McbA family metallohydrolase [Kiritimatiellaeota bacterium]|nr:CehA/McbA family metallohydrolase [Kiritimatiellota bacterium]
MKTNSNMWHAKGIWLKGNTHTHTTASDGVCTPAEIASEYKRHGYDFVFLTDHEKRTVPDQTIRKPLLIPAEEIHFSQRYKGYEYHFVCLGLKKEWAAGSCRSPMQVLARARREGAFIILAHPYWCGVPSHKCVYQGGLTCPGVEVYNKVCDRGIAKGYSSVHWDDLLDAGHRVLGFAVDDAHARSDIAGGWIMVKARNCTPATILSAIRNGSFYSSQGPEIKSIVIRGREIKVTCSPVARINFITNRNEGCSISTAMKSLTNAVWTAPKGKRYVRIELVSASGKMAWSNPIFF